MNSVIFKDKAAAGIGKKLTSLFPGIGYAAGYKVDVISNGTDRRYPSEYINMEDNYGFEISSPNITETLSIEFLAKEPERQCYTPQQGGTIRS